MKQFIVKIPTGETLETVAASITVLDEESQKIMIDNLKRIKPQFPAGIVSNSHEVNGYTIKLVICNSILWELNSLFIELELDWEALAVEGELIDETIILPFMDDKIIRDDDGEQIGVESLTDCSSLQTYAGRKWRL